MIGSDTFIIVAFRCTENRIPSRLAAAIWSARNASSAARRMTAASTTSPASTGNSGLSTVTLPSASTCSIRIVLSAAIVTDCSVALKSPSSIVTTRDFECRRPVAHRVRVVARVGLDRSRRATVGVALAQHRVDGRALDVVVALADVAQLVGARIVGVVGDRVAGRLELGDGRLQLRQRGRDVRQLDDVRVGRDRQLAELGQRVGDPLLGLEPIRELGQDPP